MALSPATEICVQALSLEERREAIIPSRAGLSSSQLARAQRRVEECRRWFLSADGRDHWPEFLKRVRLTEPELLQLAEPVMIIGERLPSWEKTLRNLIGGLATSEKRLPPGVTDIKRFVVPVVEYCWRGLSSSSPDLELFSYSARATWKQLLCARLAQSARQIFAWENENPGYGQKVDLQSSIRSSGRQSGCLDLLNRYPALARLWARQIDHWTSFVGDVLTDTKEFLCSHGVADSRQRVAVTKVTPELSDLHRGNRSVLQMRFRDGSLWFYKPRSGSDEYAWYELLRLINKAGFSKPLRIVRVIPGERHSWMEEVGHKASRSKKEVEAFFYRGGVLLYLAHIFRAVDLHAGNLVAHGEHPVLVDCETFLHPATAVPTLARWSMSPLVRTGLLPARLEPMDEREEITAFGRAEPGPHRQEWRGRAQFAGQFIEDFLCGFTDMHALVAKKDLVTKAMKLFPQSGRVIYRPTQYYQAVYHNSLAPGTLMNGFDRSIFLHAACRPGPIPQRCLQSEVTALADGDVPLFRERRPSPRPPPSAAAMRLLAKRIQTLLRGNTT